MNDHLARMNLSQMGQMNPKEHCKNSEKMRELRSERKLIIRTSWNRNCELKMGFRCFLQNKRK